MRETSVFLTFAANRDFPSSLLLLEKQKHRTKEYEGSATLVASPVIDLVHSSRCVNCQGALTLPDLKTISQRQPNIKEEKAESRFWSASDGASSGGCVFPGAVGAESGRGPGGRDGVGEHAGRDAVALVYVRLRHLGALQRVRPGHRGPALGTQLHPIQLQRQRQVELLVDKYVLLLLRVHEGLPPPQQVDAPQLSTRKSNFSSLKRAVL